MIKHTHPEAPAIDLLDLSMHWQQIQRNKWLLLSISVCMSMICICYALLKPTTYQASVLLQIHHNQESSIGAVTNEDQQSEKINLMVEPPSVQIALIRSRFILEPVVDSLHLDTLKKMPKWKLINQIRSRLTITDLSGTSDNFPNKPGLLQLTMTGENANDVMKLLNCIAETTQLKDRERKSMEANKTLQFLYQQLPIIQNSLKDAENKLNQYQQQSGKVNTALQTQYLFTHLSDLDKQLEAMHVKKIELSQQLTALHPTRIALENSTHELEKQRSDIFSQIKKMTATDQLSNNLERDIAVKKNLYMTLLNKIHQQEVINAGVISDIGVLAFATSAEPAFTLGKSMIAIAGAVIGLIIGWFYILIRQIMRRHNHLSVLENTNFNREHTDQYAAG